MLAYPIWTSLVIDYRQDNTLKEYVGGLEPKYHEGIYDIVDRYLRCTTKSERMAFRWGVRAIFLLVWLAPGELNKVLTIVNSCLDRADILITESTRDGDIQ